ncbi:MAG: glycosyltransferase [Thermodesulfobacteriota bacterium]
MLTILHTESSLGWGGQEIRILQESLGMKARGYRVLVAAPPKSLLLPRAEKAGLEIIPLELAPQYPWVFRQMVSILDKKEIDILNTHSSSDSWLGILAAQISGRKPLIIRTRHLSTPISKNLWSRLIYDILPDAVITTGEEIRRQMILENNFDGDKIFSIPTGIDLEEFDPEKIKPSLPHKGLAVGMVGVLRSWKGHQYFLRAVPLILQEIPDAQFYIVGDGPQLNNIKNAIEELRLQNKVILLGHREDIPEIIASLDILVHPSYGHEGVPQTILQALAMRKPVVATRVGSIPEVIIEGRTGILIPPRDAEKIAEGVIEIYKNSELRQILIENGREYIKEKYSHKIMLDRLEELYGDLLSGRLKKRERLVPRLKNLLIKKCMLFAPKIGLGPKKYSAGKPNRFLIITTTGIGDTLWGTPAIRALKEAYPHSYIGVLTNRLGLEILQGNPRVDKFFIFDKGLKSVISWPWLLISLRQSNFHTAFIFHSSDRLIWPFCYLAGPNERIGIKGENKGLDFLLTKAVCPPSGLHGVEKRMYLLQQFDRHFSTVRYPLELYLNGRDREAVKNFLRSQGINLKQPLIGLHPGAQKPFKCWPWERFVEVGLFLQQKYRAIIFITGNGKEQEIACKIANNIPQAIAVAGRFSLRETAALIERLNLFITNDTGPMHIAFALGTPAIALFAATDPAQCGPYLDQRPIVIYRQKTCHLCLGKKCTHPKCLEQITSEEVLAAAEILMDQKPL